MWVTTVSGVLSMFGRLEPEVSDLYTYYQLRTKVKTICKEMLTGRFVVGCGGAPLGVVTVHGLPEVVAVRLELPFRL